MPLQELAHGRPPLARMHPMRVLMDTMHKPAPQLDDPPHGTQFSKVRICAWRLLNLLGLCWRLTRLSPHVMSQQQQAGPQVCCSDGQQAPA